MPKVTLTRAVAWPYPHGLMRHSGTVLDVTAAEQDKLMKLGVVAEPAEPVAEPAHAPAEPAEPVAEPAHAPAEPAGDTPQRPKNTAKIDVWRKYAEALGVDHKGLDKAEIIAATR